MIKLSNPESGVTFDFALIPVPDGNAVLALGRDVSLDHNLRAALVDSRQRYKDLVEISSDFVWETGPLGQFVFVSASGALGYEPDELVGHSAAEFLVGGANTPNPFGVDEPIQAMEVRIRKADGTVAILEASAAPLLDEHGDWCGVRGLCRDVTEARRQETELAKARNRERLTAYILRAIRDEIEPGHMLEAAAEAVRQAFDADGAAFYQIEPGAGLVQTRTAGAPIPEPCFEAVRDEITDQWGASNQSVAEGVVLAHQLSYHRTMNGAVVLYRREPGGSWGPEDEALISEVAGHLGIAMRQAEAHHHLQVLSLTDAMTGLLNRRAFETSMSKRLDDPADRRPGILVYVDLDNFKQVNDVRGHKTGDKALIHVANILSHTADGDLAARIGGDEFALWLEDCDGEAAAGRAKTIIEAGNALDVYSGQADKPLTLSLGLAVHLPGAIDSLDSLMQQADQVMYDIKRSGKGWFRIAPVITRQPS